jgi:hypothetical protein
LPKIYLGFAEKKSEGHGFPFFTRVVWFSDWDGPLWSSPWGHHAWYFGFGGLQRGAVWLGFLPCLFRFSEKSKGLFSIC